jgi:hypothetical protein
MTGVHARNSVMSLMYYNHVTSGLNILQDSSLRDNEMCIVVYCTCILNKLYLVIPFHHSLLQLTIFMCMLKVKVKMR